MIGMSRGRIVLVNGLKIDFDYFLKLDVGNYPYSGYSRTVPCENGTYRAYYIEGAVRLGTLRWNASAFGTSRAGELCVNGLSHKLPGWEYDANEIIAGTSGFATAEEAENHYLGAYDGDSGTTFTVTTNQFLFGTGGRPSFKDGYIKYGFLKIA